MSYSQLRKQVQQAAPQEPEGPQMCMATGCPCLATLQIEGGRWCCTSHAFAVSDLWPRITEGLRGHDWLLAFTRDVQSMDRKHEDWRGFAEKFWDGQDDYCKPHPKEPMVAYFNRMKGELDYRLGLCKRPAPRIPEELGAIFSDMAGSSWKRAIGGLG